jgi:hypothetical protein
MIPPLVELPAIAETMLTASPSEGPWYELVGLGLCHST